MMSRTLRFRAPDRREGDAGRATDECIPRSRWRALACPSTGELPPQGGGTDLSRQGGVFPQAQLGWEGSARVSGGAGGRAPAGPAGEARSTSRAPSTGDLQPGPGPSPSTCGQEGRQAAGRSGAPPWPEATQAGPSGPCV